MICNEYSKRYVRKNIICSSLMSITKGGSYSHKKLGRARRRGLKKIKIEQGKKRSLKPAQQIIVSATDHH
jgi:hypothetical protein